MKRLLLALSFVLSTSCAVQSTQESVWMDQLIVDDAIFLVVIESVPVLVVDNRTEKRRYYVGQKMIEFLEKLTNEDMTLLWEVKRDYPPVGWEVFRGKHTQG